MPAATVTIIPGYLPPDGTPITCAVLRQIAQPSASANFSIPPATLNFFFNGNFNKTLWANLTGISATSVNTEPMTVVEPQGWVVGATPTGVGDLLTVLPSTDVPNQQSYYSMEIDGTSVGFSSLGAYQQILSDIAAILEGQQVTVSLWLKNLQSGTFTPVANFLSPTNVQDLFTGPMTNIASANFQTVSQGVWTKLTATVTLSNGLINNGLQVEIDFPVASLTALSGGTVQFRLSQMFLQIGNVSTSFQSDPGLIEDVRTPSQSRIIFGPLGSVVSTMNGDMQIWQRGISFVSPANAVKLADRFQVLNTMATGTATISQQALELPGITNQYPYTKYSTRIAVTAPEATPGAGEYFGISQRIERQFARVLFNRSTSLSVILQSSVIGVFCIAIRNQALLNSITYECPIGLVNTPYRFTFPNIPPFPTTGNNWGALDTDFSYEVVVIAACGTAFQNTAGVWLSASYLASPNQKNLFQVNGSTLDITLIQHEQGSICTPFMWVPFDQSLQRCQRYYNKSFDYGVYPGAATANGAVFGVQFGTTAANLFIRFPSRMRITGGAGFTYSTTTGTTGTLRDITAGADRNTSALSISESGIASCSTSAGTVGNNLFTHYTNDVEL